MSDKASPPNQLILNFPAQPEYRFSNFIVSNSSEFAFTAAKQFCSGDPSVSGSLFIFGDAGLGKTHLLISIGNHVAENLPGQKTLYIGCANFIRKIEEDEATSAGEFIEQILDIDYFLMDDVEKIAGSASAQEKLHFIYNSLAAKSKRIAFASSRSPDNLPGVADFLVSRFQWGIAVPLRPIDDRATAGIIKKLGEDLNLDVPDVAIAFLLNRIPRDFQSLHDALDRINRQSYQQKRKVTLALVKEALGLASALD